jgi:hypothetical protein
VAHGNIDVFLASVTHADAVSLVLGGLRLPDRLRERDQRCLLVPILLHLQVHLRSLARASHHWVSVLFQGSLHLLTGLLAALKSYSAPSSSPSLLATSRELVQLLPTFDPRSMVPPRLCRRLPLSPLLSARLSKLPPRYGGLVGLLRL